MRIEDAAGPPDRRRVAVRDRLARRAADHLHGQRRRAPGHARAPEPERCGSTPARTWRTVERATATGDVDLVSGAGAPLPGSTAPASETKRLRSQRLEIVFRAKGILQEAVATGAASLEIEPGPSEKAERRRVSGPRLRFDFDAEGRLLSVQGPRGTSARSGARDRSLLTRRAARAGRLSRAAGRERHVRGVARPADGRGARRRVRGLGGVRGAGAQGLGRPLRLRRRGGHAACSRATRASWTRPRARSCEGREIRIGTRTRAVQASGNVRHSVAGEGPRRRRPAAGPGADRVRVPRVRVRPADANGALPRERARPLGNRRGAGAAHHARRGRGPGSGA